MAITKESMNIDVSLNISSVQKSIQEFKAEIESCANTAKETASIIEQVFKKLFDNIKSSSNDLALIERLNVIGVNSNLGNQKNETLPKPQGTPVEEGEQEDPQNTQVGSDTDQAKEDAKNLWDMQEKYRKYAEGIVKIEAGAQKKISEIRNNDKLSKKDKGNLIDEVVQISEAEKEQLTVQTGEEISELPEQLTSIVTNTVNMGLTKILENIPRIKAELARLQKEGADPEQVAKLQAELTAAEHAVTSAKEKAIDTSNADAKKTEKTWAGVNKALGFVESATKDVQTAFGDMMDESGKAAMQTIQTVAASSIQMATLITSLVTTAALKMSALEKASVILTIISLAVTAGMAIYNAFKSENDRGFEENIKTQQKKIEELEQSYQTLGEQIEKAYSSDASKLIEQQNTLLEQQKQAIRLQIASEEAKKDTDQSKIDQWKAQLSALDGQIADNKAKQVDAIFGSDVKSAIDDFASAIAESWSGGTESGANRAKEMTKKMIKGIINELLKSNVAGEVDRLRNKIAGFMNDEVLSEQEIAEIEADSERIFDSQNKVGKQYEKIYKEDTFSDKESLTGAIRGSVATEQSVSELGGIFRGQWETLIRIEGYSMNLSEVATLNASIAANTLRTANNTDGLVSAVRSLEVKLENIERNTKPDHARY